MGQAHNSANAASIAWAQAHRHPNVQVTSSIVHWDLGAGESQVIALCLETSAVAVLDDGEARACAQAHELGLIGTLGIILRARRLGLVPAARPLIHQLIAVGSFLNQDLVERELAKLQE